MKRRDFLVFLGSSLVANPMAATGQKVTPSRIGFLRVGPPPPTYIGGFREGLQEQGLVEGRDFVIGYALAQSAAQIPETAVHSPAPSRTSSSLPEHLLSSRPEMLRVVSL